MSHLPHFAIPFRFANGRAVVNEQDSDTEILACVEAVLRYTEGQRPESPEFGVPDQLFGELPLDTDAVQAQVDRWEPRARSSVSGEYDAELATAIERVQVEIPADAGEGSDE